MERCISALIDLSARWRGGSEAAEAVAQAAIDLVFQTMDCNDLELTGLGARASEGLLNWYRLTHALSGATRDNATRKAVVDAMTPWHVCTYQVLRDWWVASYQESSYSLAAVLDLVDSCEDDLEAVRVEEGGLDKAGWDRVMRALDLTHWPLGDIEEPDTPLSLIYHMAVLELFQSEFLGDTVLENEAAPRWCAKLHYRRQEALNGAFVRHLAWSTCHSTTTDKIHRSLPKTGGGVVFSDDHTVTTTSRTFLARGPAVDPCPWLEKRAHDDADSLPYFLWDVEGLKTVKTSTLKQYPEYTVVSHTWGRWTKTEPPVSMVGVPWPVPQNSRFEVLDLPALLTSLPSRTPYVWIDLLCIPQDHSALGTREISRQARIFQGARHAIAWLNDVESLEGLGYVAMWQALHLVEFSSAEDEEKRMAMMERAWQVMSGKSCGLLVGHEGNLSSSSTWGDDMLTVLRGSLNPWFTSLWTLQEIALRPDMWLCARDFSFATCDGVAPLPVSGIVAIESKFHGFGDLQKELDELIRSRAADKTHAAFWGVKLWATLSGLDGLLHLDRVRILNLGDRRQCPGRRAEAIMSALGVTKWYDDARSIGHGDAFQARLEQNLVMDKYPLEFVRELCESIPGSEFFTGVLKMSHVPSNCLTLSLSPGSMLPFGVRQSVWSWMNLDVIDTPFSRATHPSVSTWTVLPSGQVHLREACVVGSSSRRRSFNGARWNCWMSDIRNQGADDHCTYTTAANAEEDYALLGNRQLTGKRFMEVALRVEKHVEASSTRDIESWMSNQLCDTYLVLVSSLVSQDRDMDIWGLILQRQTTGMLIKTGHFDSRKAKDWVDASTTERVDWIIS